MSKKIIKLTYRHIINSFSTEPFEKNIFHYSYEEFLLKCQVYNPEGKFKTFAELKANDGRANSLHYKAGFAVIGFIDGLQKKIPLLTDTLGQSLSFDNYKFEVIETDISNRQLHKVALHFTTSNLILHKSLGDFIIVSKEKKEKNLQETFTIRMQPNLAIVHYEEK